MIGEPKFGGENFYFPKAEQPQESPEQKAEKEKTFDASLIKYATEGEEDWHGRQNEILCERLNAGERFALVFRDSVSGGLGVTEGLWTYNSEHLDQAVIVLGDGKRMRFSHFEAATGRDFRQAMTEGYWKGSEDTRKHEDEIIAEVGAMEKWLKAHFGEQFAGLVEPKFDFGQEPDEPHDKASGQAITMIKGDSPALEGPELNA